MKVITAKHQHHRRKPAEVMEILFCGFFRIGRMISDELRKSIIFRTAHLRCFHNITEKAIDHIPGKGIDSHGMRLIYKPSGVSGNDCGRTSVMMQIPAIHNNRSHFTERLSIEQSVTDVLIHGVDPFKQFLPCRITEFTGVPDQIDQLRKCFSDPVAFIRCGQPDKGLPER